MALRGVLAISTAGSCWVMVARLTERIVVSFRFG
jgi:hypothetical protein